MNQLPAPPKGKSNWPWVSKVKPWPKTMPDGTTWPKISIVTPSFNQGKFIEETIRSVLLQNYPNLEYIIMDGGSTDNSIEVIKKYEPLFTHWVSEEDNGQADAIYRGFENASGEIIAWINSDDFYLPDAFKQIALAYRESAFDYFVGGHIMIDEKSRKTGRLKGYSQDFNSLLCFGQYIAQPACFWTRKSFFEVGGYHRNLNFAFDYDLFLRLAKNYKQKKLYKYLSAYRVHSAAKSSTIWNEVGIYEVNIIQQYHCIGSIDEKKKNKIINKERLRFLFYQCKSIHNILLNPNLLLAVIKRSFLYISNSFI